MNDAESSAGDLAEKKHRVLVSLAIVVFVLSFAAAIEINSSLIQVSLLAANYIVPIFLILKWCRLDAEQRRFNLWRRFALFTVVFPGALITVPYYLLASRGARGLVAVCIAVLYAVLLLCLEAAGLYLGDTI